MSTPRTAPLWEPGPALRERSRLNDYVAWLERRGLQPPPAGDYEALWRWSVADAGRFWTSVVDYFGVELGETPAAALVGDVERAEWFAGATVNYAAHAFRQASDGRPAFITALEASEPQARSWAYLTAEVAAFQAVLLGAGVEQGDRVVGFVANGEHALIAFLAAAGLGAVWSSCSPDFGADAVRERFAQLAPTVLIASRAYRYGGQRYVRSAVLTDLAAALPSLRLRVSIEHPRAAEEPLPGWVMWGSWPAVDAAPTFRALPFAHPLWVLFSSGTTGKPKAIVHSHGGCLLEHLKYLGLQMDVRAGERLLWFTTTGWMMWNFLQAALLVGAVPVFYDGSAGYPDLLALWRLAAKLPVHHFGTSAPFLHACLRKRVAVAAEVDLAPLRSIGSTGAPLSPEGFDYVYAQVKRDVWLASMSGGTDVCTAFVGGAPWKPVYAGRIQARALGCDLHAYGPHGEPVVDRVGELVVRQPMPSMPVFFWDDAGGERLHESYFADVPGVWRHGDFIEVGADGSVVIHGRSDATLNRQGVRIGTAEIYRVVAGFTEVEDSLVIHYEGIAGREEMPLFVRLAAGATLTPQLKADLCTALRTSNSPRHVPTRIEAVADIPYTLSGKRVEAPVKRLFQGAPLAEVADLGSVRNPDALRAFAHLAARKPARR